MRLIDADVLYNTMCHEAFEVDSDFKRWDSGCWIRFKLFENVLENFPTVDAVPMEHGQWLTAVNPDGTVINGVKQCSNCGEIFNEYPNYDYCGNCGSNNGKTMNERRTD